MLKYIVRVDYKKFKFNDQASAMTFASMAKNTSMDEIEVTVEIILEDDEEDDADV